MSTNNGQDYRLSSRQRKHNAEVLPEILEAPELLGKRRKRACSSYMNRDNIVYQRFIRDLEKEIKVYIKQTLRESRFDTRTNRSSDTNSTIQSMVTTLTSIRAASTVGTHRSNETVVSRTSIGREKKSSIENPETKRLSADVQTILGGPAMKNFYVQFIQSSQRHRHQQDPWEQLLLYASEQK